MKKFFNNTIVQLLIAVIVGILAGFYVEGTVLSAIISIKHLTGQIIFFLVPLIILGFIAPSIAHLSVLSEPEFFCEDDVCLFPACFHRDLLFRYRRRALTFPSRDP